MGFAITRSIGIDYGHRVMTHGSKCRSIHGHRGTIEVTCSASALQRSGEQSAMVMDFGFLKEVMLNVIDRSIDHGFVACVEDEELLSHLVPEAINIPQPIRYIRECLEEQGYWLSDEVRPTKLNTLVGTKLYVLANIQTSERLAEHFFKRLILPVQQRSDGAASLTNLRFWETPSCYADFPGLATNGQ